MDQATQETEPAHAHFERWADAARGRAELWRTLLGLLLILGVWGLWAWVEIALVYEFADAAGSDSAVGAAVLGQEFVRGETPAGLFLLLLSFGGMWAGTWAALRLLHARPLASVISHDGRPRLRQFGAGAAIGVVLYGAATAYDMATGEGIIRTGLGVGEWLLLLAPLAALNLLQAGGEEVVFRGYLMQQLAARFRSPMAWWIASSVLFGAMHYSYGEQSPAYGVWYVCSTTLFGLAAGVTVWRSGGLATAMGLHAGHNFSYDAFIGEQGIMSGANLWVAPFVPEADWPLLVCDIALLAYVASPWAPFAKETALFGRRP